MKLLSTILGFLMMLSITAQVGVNNPSPEQALDVNGKIKVTDDSTAPSAGTMRYNDSDSSFEGYDGIKWNSFTSTKSSALPSNPIPVFGYVEDVRKLLTKPISFKSWIPGINFQEVPAGKLVIITAIFPRPYDTYINQKFQCLMGPADNSTGFPAQSNGALLIYSETVVSEIYSGSQAPIFVIRAGQFLNVRGLSSSEIDNFNMDVRGFIVDDLNY